MRPDQRWFPTNRNARAAWFANFSEQFAEAGIALGFTQDEIDGVAADNASLKYTATALTSIEAYLRSARAFEKEMTEGRNTPGNPQFPTCPLPPMPPAVDSGIFERLERIVRRIRLSAGYTQAIGSSLGIVPTASRLDRPQEFVPKLKITALADAYTFTVHSPKLSFSGMNVEVRSANSGAWRDFGRFFKSPAKLALTPTNPGQPEQITVRIRMLEQDTPVTAYSAAVTVTVNP